MNKDTIKSTAEDIVNQASLYSYIPLQLRNYFILLIDIAIKKGYLKGYDDGSKGKLPEITPLKFNQEANKLKEIFKFKKEE